MRLSKYAIESMGYSEFPQTDLIEVCFGIIKVYTLQGMVFEQDCEKNLSDITSVTERCNIVIAHSVNDASTMLAGGIFVDDEEKWLSDKKVSPPFLLIYFKESSPVGLAGGYRQEKDGIIYTYDAFPEGKKEIKKWLDEELPGIVTSLTVNLSSLERQVDLVPVEESIFGTTNEGKVLIDSKLTGNFRGSVSSPKSIENINASLGNVKGLLPVLTKDVCRHFYSALNEPDRMKSFLSYFQFIERYTHSTYKSLSYVSDVQKLFIVPERVKEPTSKFFEKIFIDSKNLSQRFHWCSILAWETIDESDVDCFLEIKKVRDKLSHGEHLEEAELPVGKAKALALKLLGTN